MRRPSASRASALTPEKVPTPPPAAQAPELSPLDTEMPLPPSTSGRHSRPEMISGFNASTGSTYGAQSLRIASRRIARDVGPASGARARSRTRAVPAVDISLPRRNTKTGARARAGSRDRGQHHSRGVGDQRVDAPCHQLARPRRLVDRPREDREA